MAHLVFVFILSFCLHSCMHDNIRRITQTSYFLCPLGTWCHWMLQLQPHEDTFSPSTSEEALASGRRCAGETLEGNRCPLISLREPLDTFNSRFFLLTSSITLPGFQALAQNLCKADSYSCEPRYVSTCMVIECQLLCFLSIAGNDCFNGREA